MSIFSPNIIKIGLLGTNAKQLELSIFPLAVQGHLDDTKEASLVYLDGISLTHAYAFGGQELTKLEGVSEAIPICPDENLPYCDASVIHALEIILKGPKLGVEVFLPLVIQHVNNQNVILPAKFILDFQPLIKKKGALVKLRAATIQAFGARGKWIFSLAKMDTSTGEVELLDMSKAERKKYFAQVYKSGETEKIITFLEEVFLAESTAGQKAYLKVMSPILSAKDKPIIDFLEEAIGSINSKTKAHLSLVAYFELLKITLAPSEAFKSFYEETFSQIWTKKKGILSSKLKIKTKSALEQIFHPLEAFPIADYLATCYESKWTDYAGVLTLYTSYSVENGSVDQYLYFTLATVPVEVWCSALGLTKKQFVKTVHAIKKLDKAEMTSYSFVEALVFNSYRHQDLELAIEIYNLLGFNEINPSFVAMMPTEKAFEFLGNNLKNFKKFGFDLIGLAVKDIGLRKQWNADFTKVAIENCLQTYQDNGTASIVLWSGAPYFDKSTLLQASAFVDDTNHSEKMLDVFNEILTVKTAYDKIKN